MSRNASKINPRLNKKLTAYAAAATAIGVGTLTAAQPAEAEIVFTKTHIEVNGGTPIDLNRDGITDFTFARIGHGSYGSILIVNAAAGNAFFGQRTSALPVPFGGSIGPTGKFGAPEAQLALFSFRSGSFSGGTWAGAVNQYMGLKFLINGKQHFGWARITVENLQAHISGFAYETIANKPIRAGYQGGGPAETADVSPVGQRPVRKAGATLGMLGLGADAISLWRREEAAIAA